MTPDQARDLLDGADSAPWEVDESDHHMWAIGPIAGSANGGGLCCEIEDAHLAAAAPDMAAMLAGMREEWGVEERHEWTREWTWHSTHPDRESACNAVNGMDHFRVARRYVTTPEEA